MDASKNTGQIAKIEDFVGGLGPQNKLNEQRYVYDALGRLHLAAEYQGSDGSLVWRTDYGYDRYGNRLQSAQAEENTWVTQLRAAQGQGQSALLAQAQSLGSTLFNSAEYAARQRTDGEFVNDLYWGYLQRAADADGYVFWLNYTQTNGRAATINAFGQSIEFNNLTASLCVNNQLAGDLHWVLTDHLSSVRVVLDSGGNVVGRRDDLPFGDALREVNEPGQMGPMSAQRLRPSP